MAAPWVRILIGAAIVGSPSPVAAWYTEAGSPAWAYRVPVVIPSGSAIHSTVILSVDFNALFTQIGLNAAATTLDASSPRVVRGNDALATRQEFNDTVYAGAVDVAGNERGEIRFILEDAPGSGTYYLYFDTAGNGAKPVNPAAVINATFEQSSGTVPSQWTTAVLNAGANRNAEVYRTAAGATVDVAAGCGTADTPGVDAGPNNASGVATGTAWYLMGFRDRCEDGGVLNEQVTLSRGIDVPAGAAAGDLTFYFQVQGFDGIVDAGSYDWIVVSVNGAAATHTGLGISNTTTPQLVIETSRLGRNGRGTTYLDHGWKKASLDLSGYAGQAVTLAFTSRHHTDNDFRSWVKLDDVEWSVQAGALGPPEAFGGGIGGFDISHDGFGIHCVDEAIAVTALDTTGNVATNYAGQIGLNTQSGKGTWLPGTGSGVLVDTIANDGVATYQFAAADNGVATFLLQYREGASPLDVDAFQTSDASIRDDDTEGALTFAANGFTVTRIALTNPPPASIGNPLTTQIAGTPFDVHLAAYGQVDNDPVCGIVETYTGTRAVAFWLDRVNPAGGALTATVDGVAAATSSGAAAPQAVVFTAGQAVVRAKYKDTGSVRINARDSTNPAEPVTGGSNTFVVKPADLAVALVTTSGGSTNPGASTPTGAAFVPSGAAFRVEVEARDSEGDPTPNFGAESPPETLLLTSASLVVPVGGRHGSTGTGALVNGGSFVQSGAGRWRNTEVVFDEVGVIRLNAVVADGDYLGTGALTGTVSGNVGRFYPSAFSLAAGSAVTAACSGFTYMSQPEFGVSFTLEAVNALGAVTENYDATLLGGGAVSNVSFVAENGDDGVDRGSRLAGLNSTWVSGRYAVTTTTGVFLRTAAADGPFDFMQMGARVADPLDSVSLSGLNMNASGVGDCTAMANCSASRIGPATRFVYGRLAAMPAFGPETHDLAVPLETQRFENGAFTVEVADVCTRYSAGAATLSAHSGNLGVGETAVTAPVASTAFVGGRTDPNAPLVLSAPGIGKDGAVELTFDAPAWLEFDWYGAGATDPQADVRFGRYRGHDRIIYRREL